METQQQEQQYHYHYQTQSDPSQVQSYDPSTQGYYTYNQLHYNQTHQQQQQDYSSYYYPDYSNSYQTHQPHNDPNSIHPPGVPISVDTQQNYVQNSQSLYYPHGVVTPQPPPSRGYMMSGHSAYRGGGTGRPVRGSGRGGRGRGGGRGKHAPPQTSGSAPAAADGVAAQSMGSSSNDASGKPPLQMAWCELCRVDCNTTEILEQHKNGKKHKRNLKVYEELQNLSKGSVLNPQMSVVQPKPDNVPSDKPQGSEPAEVENKSDTAPENDVAHKAEPSSGALPPQVSTMKDHFGGRGGFKRRMRGGRGGRGGKWMRAYDGSRRPFEPPKPKQVVPIICDLCNVKCESQVVFESHIAGKKHLSNVKRFEGHKKAFGEGVKDLYPTIPNLPSTSIVPQANQQSSQDAQALASMMLSQHNLPDPQAAQAALAQLLNQHGIYDAQTLVAQLIPYLVAQFQAPGSVPVPVPVPVATLGTDAQNSQIQEAQLSIGAESQNVDTETKTEQPNIAANVESQTGTEMNDKPSDAQSSDNQVIKPSEDGNVGAEPVIPAPAEEATV